MAAIPAAPGFAEPLRVGTRIVGTAPIVAPLKACVDAALAKTPGYALVDKLPLVELVAYANSDVDDDINKNGVSIAVAYVNHVDAIRLGKLALSGGAAASPEVKTIATDLIRSGGELDRINVVHMGTPSEAATADVCKAIVTEFAGKYPAQP